MLCPPSPFVLLSLVQPLHLLPQELLWIMRPKHISFSEISCFWMVFWSVLTCTGDGSALPSHMREKGGGPCRPDPPASTG